MRGAIAFLPQNAARIAAKSRFLRRNPLFNLGDACPPTSVIPDVHSRQPSSCYSYSYDKPVALGPQLIRLRPAPHTRTAIPAYALKVSPAEHFLNWQQDPFGNWQARLVFPEKTTEFKIEVDLLANLSVINPFDFFIEDLCRAFPLHLCRRGEDRADAVSGTGGRRPAAGRVVAAIPREKKRTVDFLVELEPEDPGRCGLCDPHGARRADAG